MESDGKKGDRWLRLGDVAPHEVIVVRCPCERSVEYPPGFLQRRYRLASDMLVYDLQFRLRCEGCNRRSGFRITIFDERTRGDSSKPRLERVVVAGECGVELVTPEACRTASQSDLLPWRTTPFRILYTEAPVALFNAWRLNQTRD